jgi:hypothetical protein
MSFAFPRAAEAKRLHALSRRVTPGYTTAEGVVMGFGASLVLMAAGAILWWAVTVDAEGVNLNTVGMILFVVGAVGLVLSLVFWSSWGGFGSRRRVEYVEREGYYPEDTPVRERERML